MTPSQQLHGLACGVHGALVALHLLGLAYNAIRRNRFDCAAHLFGAVYSVRSVKRHLTQL